MKVIFNVDVFQIESRENLSGTYPMFISVFVQIVRPYFISVFNRYVVQNASLDSTCIPISELIVERIV